MRSAMLKQTKHMCVRPSISDKIRNYVGMKYLKIVTDTVAIVLSYCRYLLIVKR